MLVRKTPKNQHIHKNTQFPTLTHFLSLKSPSLRPIKDLKKRSFSFVFIRSFPL